MATPVINTTRPQASWSIRSSRADGRRTIYVTFTGRVSEADGRSSAVQALDFMAGGPVHLVLDLVDIAGYDTGARLAWQEQLWPHRAQLESLTIVSGSAVTRMGGNLFGALMGAPYRMLDSRHDLGCAPSD